jgi:hypothetical protein
MLTQSYEYEATQSYDIQVRVFEKQGHCCTIRTQLLHSHSKRVYVVGLGTFTSRIRSVYMVETGLGAGVLHTTRTQLLIALITRQGGQLATPAAFASLVVDVITPRQNGHTGNHMRQ